MSPLDLPLAEWTSDHVGRLVSNEVQEGQRLEYKQALSLESRSEKDEAAKDVSGLANAVGGWLIYGVAEETLADGRVVPSRVTPIEDAAIEERLADVLASSVVPRLNIETRQVPVDSGYVLVCRIYQRAGAPHMVQAYGDNRYYQRSGSSTRPMTAYEIELAFAGLGQRADRAIVRLASVISPVAGTEGHLSVTMPPSSDGRSQPMWTSLIALPLDAPDPLLRVTAGTIEDLSRAVFEILGGGSSFQPTADGLSADDDQAGWVRGRCRVFANGVIETGDGAFTRSGFSGPIVPSSSILRDTYRFLSFAGATYETMGYHGRARIFLCLDGTQGATLALPEDWFPPHREIVLSGGHYETSEDVNVDSLQGNPIPTVRLLMDWLWNCFGYDRCRLFEEDGSVREKTVKQLGIPAR